MKPGGCCRRDEMRLEEDFSKVYEAEMQELKEFCENHVNSPQEEAEKAEELEFIKKVVYSNGFGAAAFLGAAYNHLCHGVISFL